MVDDDIKYVIPRNGYCQANDSFPLLAVVAEGGDNNNEEDPIVVVVLDDSLLWLLLIPNDFMILDFRPEDCVCVCVLVCCLRRYRLQTF